MRKKASVGRKKMVERPAKEGGILPQEERVFYEVGTISAQTSNRRKLVDLNSLQNKNGRCKPAEQDKQTARFSGKKRSRARSTNRTSIDLPEEKKKRRLQYLRKVRMKKNSSKREILLRTR